MGLFINIAHAMRDAAEEGEDVAKHVMAHIIAHPEVIALGAGLDLTSTREPENPNRAIAIADATRALRAAFPDRWEGILGAMDSHPIAARVIEIYHADLCTELDHPHWTVDQRYALEKALKWLEDAIKKSYQR